MTNVAPIQTSFSETDLNGNKKQYFKCPMCLEPYWIEDVIEEICPACEKWNSLGKYKEWVVDENS